MGKGILALLAQIGSGMTLQFSHGAAVMGVAVGLIQTAAALALLACRLIPEEICAQVLEYGLSLTAFLAVAAAIKPVRNGGKKNVRTDPKQAEGAAPCADLCQSVSPENKTGHSA
jgi:hypothetical protein